MIYSYLCNCKLEIAILMNQRITHSGVVDSVEDGCVHVRIVQTSACAACKVAGYCNAAESKEKIIDVFNCDTAAFNVGQNVTVWASRDVANRALLLGFGLPFVIMMAVLLAVLLFTGSEGLAAVSALLSLAPYYLIIFSCRGMIQKKISFSIEVK